MRCRFALVLLLVCACASARPAPTAPGAIRLAQDLAVRALAPHVFVVTHEKPWPANSVLVEARDGTLLFIGSPYTAAATERVLAWAHERFGERPRRAIDTHFHDDAGVGGNRAYQAAGIPIHGADLTAKLISERTPNEVPPDHVFPLAEGLSLDVGEPVRVLFPGPGHSRDNVVVHFPQRRLLVGGCFIMAGQRIGNRADADLKGWAASVRALEGLDFDLLVPGHGARFDRGLLAHTLAILEADPETRLP